MVDKSLYPYYRKVQRYLYLKELIKKKTDEEVDKVTEKIKSGDFSDMKQVERSEYRVARTEEEALLPFEEKEPLPTTWWTPLAYRGSIFSAFSLPEVSVLKRELNQIQEELIKDYPPLDEAMLDKITMNDLPPKHIETDEIKGFRKIWYDGEYYHLNPAQAEYLDLVYNQFLETNNKEFDSYEVFVALESQERDINNLFRKKNPNGSKGIKEVIIKNCGKNKYYLDLDF